MLAADALLDVFALNTRQFFQQSRLGGIVKKGDGSGHQTLVIFLLIFHDVALEHLGDGLRAVVESTALDHLIELSGESSREGDADPMRVFFFSQVHTKTIKTY